MGEQPTFTPAQRIGAAHRTVLRMAETFDQLLEELLRSRELGEVSDIVTLADRETGQGLRLRISAELLDPSEVQHA